MTIFSAVGMLAEADLVVYEDHVKPVLLIARPNSVKGAGFERWTEKDDAVSGAGDMVLKINAPIAGISQCSKKKWLAEIEYSDCGPDNTAWLYEKCSSPKEAAQVIIDCYFQVEKVMLKQLIDL